MIQIRRGVFETNSSSCHSLTLGNSLPKNLVIPKKLSVCNIDQGRDFYWGSTQEKYTALVLMAESQNKLGKLIDMLYNIGVEENILSKAIPHHWNGIGIGYNNGLCEIDSYDEKEYLDEILESEDSLKRFLFSSDSYMYGEDDNNFDY